MPLEIVVQILLGTGIAFFLLSAILFNYFDISKTLNAITGGKVKDKHDSVQYEQVSKRVEPKVVNREAYSAETAKMIEGTVLLTTDNNHNEGVEETLLLEQEPRFQIEYEDTFLGQ